MNNNFRRLISICLIIAMVFLPTFGQEKKVMAYVEDEIFIRFKSDLSLQAMDDILLSFQEGIWVDGLNEKVVLEKKQAYDLLKGLYLLDLKTFSGAPLPLDRQSMALVLDMLEKIDAIDYAQANYIYDKRRSIETDVEDFYELWAFENDGSLRVGQDYYDERQGIVGMDINIKKAWDISLGSEDVIVLIADDGMDSNHLEFEGRVIQNDLLNPLDDIGKEDEFGEIIGSHGTHVAGTIGASHDSGSIVGVAPLTTLLPINILMHPNESEMNDLYETSDTAITSVAVAKEYGVKVMNNSWGSERWELVEDSDEKILVDDWDYDLVLRDVIKSVEDEILYVVAAGNDGHDNDLYPSVPDMFGSQRTGPDGEILEALKNVISVAAIDPTGMIAEYSNYGQNSVHISAPGWGIYSSYPLNEYTWLDGTSMAAPMISGVAALMYAVAPDISPQEIIDIMVRTGTPLPYANDYYKTVSDKIINAYEAVKAAQSLSVELVGVSSWAEPEVRSAISYNLVTDNIMDAYQDNISRKDFAKLIVRFYEVLSQETPPIPLVNPFIDTEDPDILKAYALNIIKGVSENTFSPDTFISRQEMAVMFYRTLGIIDSNLKQTTYEVESEDQDLIASWSMEALGFMAHHEIIKGVGNNRIDPLGLSSKEVAILLVLRTYLKFN